MNKVQRKILEAVGILSNNRFNCSSFSKKIYLISKKSEEIKSPEFVCAMNGHSLVLSESWFRERGLYVSWGTLGGGVILGFFLFFPLVMPWIYEAQIDVGGIIALSFMAFLGFLFSYPLYLLQKAS